MENNKESLSKTISENPAYFGVYLNMARHNILLVENHLDKKFNQKNSITNDEKISDSFLTRTKSENPNHLYSELIRYIPCCSIYDPEFMVTNKEKKEDKAIIASIEKGKDFATMPVHLKAVFKDINQLRNSYTHYGHTDDNWERKAKISSQTKEFLERVYSKAIKYSQRRFKNVIPDEEFTKLTNLPLFLQNEPNTLTQDGLIFLTSLFLEREFMFYFINQCHGLKNATTLTFKSKRELFGVFCLRLPHEKIISDDPKNALFLDVLNEINKVPKEIFNHLLPDQQKHFRPDFSDERNEKIAENSVREDEEDLDTYIQELQNQYRRGQRFYYLATRLIDELKMLPEFKFQIRIGKYLKKTGLKKFGNEMVKREIIDDIYGFGRLAEFIDEQKITTAINIDKIEDQRFESFAPTYDLKANKVQIKLFAGSNTALDVEKIDKEGKTVGYTYTNKVFSISIYELVKILIVEYFEPKAANQIIKDFINKNRFISDIKEIEKLKTELAIIDNKYRIYEDKNTSPERLSQYKEMMADRTGQLDAALIKYGLDSQSIPRALVDYLISVKPSNRSFAMVRKIKEMKNEARQKVSDYDEYIRPKIGEMATEIAKDIIDMVISKEKKERCTSFYYDKMQEALALYASEEKRELFAQIVKDLNLLDEKQGHPFLKYVSFKSFTKTGEFYRAYFYTKAGKKGEKGQDGSWMYRTFYTLDRNTKKTTIQVPNEGLPYIFTRLQTPHGIDDLQSWVNNFNKTAIDLPTNIFDKKIEEVLKSELLKIGEVSDGNEKWSELFKKWYQSQGLLQPFYNLERTYHAFDYEFKAGPDYDEAYKNKLEHLALKISQDKKKEAKGKFDMQYTKQKIKQLLHKVITHNERGIREIVEQDIVLAINLEVPYQIKNLNKIKEHLNETILLNEKVGGKKIEATRKRKDYGLLNKMRHDKRLKSLFTYIDADTIDYEKVRSLLKEYNDMRIRIFDHVFEVEKLVLNKFKSEVIQEQKNAYGTNHSNIKHDPYLNVLLDKGIITEREMEILKNIRDKFSHNEVPLLDDVDRGLIFESMYKIHATIIFKITDSLTTH